eukprot:6930640-Prymnesium_polylepis.2
MRDVLQYRRPIQVSRIARTHVTRDREPPHTAIRAGVSCVLVSSPHRFIGGGRGIHDDLSCRGRNTEGLFRTDQRPLLSPPCSHVP